MVSTVELKKTPTTASNARIEQHADNSLSSKECASICVLSSYQHVQGVCLHGNSELRLTFACRCNNGLGL